MLHEPMRRMKRAVWGLTRRTGLLGAWRHKHRHCVTILTAHGVMDDGADARWRPLWQRMHVEHLERVLRLLHEHYEFVPLREAVSMLRGERAARPHCMVLTFDDGYRNNFTHALPVLERLGIPATFFVCTGMTGTSRAYWIDRLDYAIQHLPRDGRSVQIGAQRIPLRFESRESLAESYLALRLALKRTYRDDFDARVTALAEELEEGAGTALADVIGGDPWAATMSWEDVGEAARRGVEIGSHTVDHVRLSHVDEQTAWQQMVRSREAVERELGASCQSLAYPNGDHDARVADAARRAGYACALGTVSGLNAPGDDLFRLRRINFPTRSHPDHVLALASGLQMAVSRLGRRLAAS
jgi:peptidoglycan/xylan/chitin deacetylase (PgdA/CDA1 family)